MFSPGKHHLSHLLLTVLLLGGWTADGAQNRSEVETASSVQLASVHSSRAIVAKEGSSMLIECNVTGGHDSIKWYNSKGSLLGDDAGERMKISVLRNSLLFVVQGYSICKPKGHLMCFKANS